MTLMHDTKYHLSNINLSSKKIKMEHYEQSRKPNECQYWLYVKSCRECLFETLCRLEKQKCKDTIGTDLITDSDL